ncbi:MAG TPA: S8 family peptidase [Herpetosiphonaceae bacterium]
MPNLVRISLGLGLSLACALAALQPAAASPTGSAKVPGQYIVVLKDNVSDVDGLTGRLAAQHGLGVLHTYKAALKGFAAKVPEGKLADLQADPNVASITQDEIVSLPVQTMAKPGGGSQAQSIPTGILRIGGNLSSTLSGNGSGSVNVDVAVIDTGIQINHPDLNVVGGKNCQTGNSYDDGHGHGTHVAGTIAAKDDANGVVGVAPGARLWAVRVLNNSGSGTTSTVICGIDWVTANAGTIEVANMSLGGSGSDSNCGGSDTYHNAICNSVNAGVTYAVAAGNSAADARSFRPATYNEVITVSALADFNGAPGGGAAATCRADVDDTFADFSNYGADVDIIAPGVCINSTWKGSAYNTISGTSMASPHVAGAAALYKANNPSASPSQVKSALQNAGNLNWNTATDPDGNPERLLNVSSF